MEVSFPKSYVAWDLETSGLNSATDRIVEIGAVIVEDGAVLSTHSWILKHPGLEIPTEASAIHGITTEMMNKEGVDPETAIKDFMALFAVTSHNNLTHNGIKFDIGFLAKELERVKIPESVRKGFMYKIRGGAVDSAALYKGSELGVPYRTNDLFYTWAERVLSIKKYGLKFNVKYLTEKMGIEVKGDLHRAVTDILATIEIYKQLIDPPEPKESGTGGGVGC